MTGLERGDEGPKRLKIDHKRTSTERPLNRREEKKESRNIRRNKRAVQTKKNFQLKKNQQARETKNGLKPKRKRCLASKIRDHTSPPTPVFVEQKRGSIYGGKGEEW